MGPSCEVLVPVIAKQRPFKGMIGPHKRIIGPAYPEIKGPWSMLHGLYKRLMVPVGPGPMGPGPGARGHAPGRGQPVLRSQRNPQEKQDLEKMTLGPNEPKGP